MVQLVKAAEWLRTHLVALFAALAGALAAWIAWGSYRRQISSLKADVDMQTAKTAVAAETARAEGHEQAAAAAGQSAAAAENVVARETAHAAGAQAAAEELTHDQVLDRINAIRARNVRNNGPRS